MGRSKKFNWFKLATVVSFSGFTALLAVSSHEVGRYAGVRASQYADVAAHSKSPVAKISNYRLANVLNPKESSYRLHLAEAYVSNTDFDAAIYTLGSSESERIRKAQLLLVTGRLDAALKAIEGLFSPSAILTRSRIQLEQGRANTAAESLPAASTDEELIQLCVSQAAGGQTDAADGIAIQISSPGKRTELRKAVGNQVALGQELYQLKLYRSALRVLTSTKDESSAKYRLLAQVYLSELPSSHENLLSARKAAAQGVKIDPANIGLRELLRDLDRELGLNAAAAEQQQRIDILTSGAI